MVGYAVRVRGDSVIEYEASSRRGQRIDGLEMGRYWTNINHELPIAFCETKTAINPFIAAEPGFIGQCGK